MIESVHFTRTLDYYDWILSFEAIDSNGNTYIAIAKSWPDGIYLLVPYPPAQIDQIQSGELDLRPIFANSDEWYICKGPILPM